VGNNGIRVEKESQIVSTTGKGITEGWLDAVGFISCRQAVTKAGIVGVAISLTKVWYGWTSM
jgi:hypothetical protein